MKKEGKCSESKGIIFLGTPLIATFALKAIIDSGLNLLAVICQPDKPNSRHNKIIYSPVKQFCIDNNIKLFQPEKLSEIKNDLLSLRPYAFITCAFGQFIPQSVLDIPKFGTINIHPSLLPKYRGGAPIHWTIINQDKISGISFVRTVLQMDAGEIYCVEKIDISKDETTSSLFNKMNNYVYEYSLKHLKNILDNKYQLKPQNDKDITLALNIKKEQEKIDLDQGAEKIAGWIKGLSDKPGGYVFLDGQKIKLFNPQVLPTKSDEISGTIIKIDKNGLVIATKTTDLLILEVQLENKKRVFVKEIVNGNHPFLVNKRFI